MGTLFENNETRQAFANLSTGSESSPLHKKKQKALQQKEKTFMDEMTPSISEHGYNSVSKRSPVSTQRSIYEEKIDFSFPSLSHSSDTVDNPPLALSVTATTNFSTIIEEDEEMLAQSQRTNSLSDSFPREDIEGLHKYEYRKHFVSPEQAENDNRDEYAKYGYGEPSMAMMIDNEDDKEVEENSKYDCGETVIPSPSIAPYSSLNDGSRKAFCPERMPRRSSMKCTSSPRSDSIRSVSEEFEIFLPFQIDPVQRRRSIAFDNTVLIQTIEPVRSLVADSQSLWFQDIEYETIKMKTLSLLDRVDHASGFMDGKKYCTRGLEKFMAPEATEVKKHQAWDCVLNEQFLQRRDGEFDEDSIANIYKYSTKRSQKEASIRGSQDAQVAQTIHQTTFRSMPI